MVRFKKRYFVVQLDREQDIYDPSSKSSLKKPRAQQDPRPLEIPDGLLAAAIKDLVQQIHGDFGRAAITTGLRTIYCNPETHLAMIQCRHGPHRLLASSLPFLTILKDEKIVPKLIYTGATIRHCYKRMEKYQRRQLDIALREMKAPPEEQEALRERIMAIRSMNPSNY